MRLSQSLQRTFNQVLFLTLMFGFAGHNSLWAQSKNSKKPQSQTGLIAVEGATVYKTADFDATIMDYLSKGKKYRISMRTYEGAGGLGVFYKIRLRKKVFGYIADNEIIPENKPGGPPGSNTEGEGDPAPNPVFDQAIDISEGAEPLYFRKFWGGGLTYLNLTEEFEGKTLTSFETMVSFKMTGPGVLFDGPPVDLEINVGFQPPPYYAAEFAENVSGLFSVGSLMLINPLSESTKGMMYYSFGVMYNFTSFQMNVTNETPPRDYDAQKLTAGVVFGAGYAFNLGSQVVRLEGKYYYEDQQYISVGLSYQFEM
ncbi:MAG: hypothetical protein R2827_08745 [Bdellovibrionales bacterium]